MSKASEWAEEVKAAKTAIPDPLEGWKPEASMKLAWVDESHGVPYMRLLWDGKPAQLFYAAEAVSLARWILDVFDDEASLPSAGASTAGTFQKGVVTYEKPPENKVPPSQRHNPKAPASGASGG